MADIDSMLSDATKPPSTSYYDEGAQETKVYMGEGEYPAHINHCETVERTIQGKYKARIFNFKVKLAKECGDRDYLCNTSTGQPVTTKGEDFIGREVRASGVFQYLHPSEGDDFEANPGRNRGYSLFCEAVGKKSKLVSVTIDGEKKKVKELPNLTEKDILGIPVIAVINKGKPWTGKDGKTRTSLEVKFVRTWDEGEKITILADGTDIPF